jgi:hypothetical protein
MAKGRHVAVRCLGSLLVLGALTGGMPACKSSSSDSSGLSPTATPTGKLSGSQANAEALYAEVQSGFTELVGAAKASSAPNPLGGIMESIDCSTLVSGGSGSVSIDENGSAPGPGTSATITYNNCSLSTGGANVSINGSETLDYTSYSSAQDFSATISVDLTVTEGGKTTTVDATEDITFDNGTATITFVGANGASLTITASDVVTKGNDETITNATYVFSSSTAGGVLKVVFDNWEVDTTNGHAIGGSVTITGADGGKAVITASPTGYTAVFTDAAGKTVSFTVKY